MSIFSNIVAQFRAWDVQINEALNGKTGETVSSRLGRYIEDKSEPVRAWLARFFCRFFLLPLSLVDGTKGKHCRGSIDDKYRR